MLWISSRNARVFEWDQGGIKQHVEPKDKGRGRNTSQSLQPQTLGYGRCGQIGLNIEVLHFHAIDSRLRTANRDAPGRYC